MRTNNSSKQKAPSGLKWKISQRVNVTMFRDTFEGLRRGGKLRCQRRHALSMASVDSGWAFGAVARRRRKNNA